MVIIWGSVENRQHDGTSRLFKQQAKLSEGDFIGASRLDSGRSTHIDSWNVCIQEVEIVIIERAAF